MVCQCCAGAKAVLYDNPRILRKIKGWECFEPQLTLTVFDDGKPAVGYFDYCAVCNLEKLKEAW
jgi:hypothetical protein